MKLILFHSSFLFITLTPCKSQNIIHFDSLGNVKESASGNTDMDTLGNNIMVIFQDSRDHYWFGSWETGLYRYDGNKVSHYTTADGLLSNRVEVIQEDKSGSLYFSTPLGVSKFDGHQFVTLRENPVPGTWTLQADDLWFRDFSFNGTVLRYDGHQLQRLKMPTAEMVEALQTNTKPLFSPYAVYSIYKDTKGNIWFGTAVAGVVRYNGSRFDWITETDVNELHNGPSNGVRSMMEDSEGQFWFNTAYRYDVYGNTGLAKTFYNRTKSIGSLDGVDLEFVEFMSIVRDDDGHLWMATYGAGVYRYTGKMIIHYPIQDKGEDITSFCIYKDRYDGLWVGTHEHGVYKFEGDRFVPVLRLN